MRNCWYVTSLPLLSAGAISEMYIGPTTESAPTASPAMRRKAISTHWLEASAQPTEEMTNSSAMARKTFLRPYLSAKLPVNIAPNRHPIVRELTTKPMPLSVKLKASLMDSTPPEMPAMLSPKMKPPITAIAVIRLMFFLSIIARINSFDLLYHKIANGVLASDCVE